jgi:hypothetical protein
VTRPRAKVAQRKKPRSSFLSLYGLPPNDIDRDDDDLHGDDGRFHQTKTKTKWEVTWNLLKAVNYNIGTGLLHTIQLLPEL